MGRMKMNYNRKEELEMVIKEQQRMIKKAEETIEYSKEILECAMQEYGEINNELLNDKQKEHIELLFNIRKSPIEISEIENIDENIIINYLKKSKLINDKCTECGETYNLVIYGKYFGMCEECASYFENLDNIKTIQNQEIIDKNNKKNQLIEEFKKNNPTYTQSDYYFNVKNDKVITTLKKDVEKYRLKKIKENGYY